MARNLGYVLGSLLLIRGLIVVARPHLVFQWVRRFRSYYPRPINQTIDDFDRMSDLALRILGTWAIATAGLILWLASSHGDRSRHDLTKYFPSAIRRQP